MSSFRHNASWFAWQASLWGILSILAIVAAPPAQAQFVTQQVGGVSIDARGVVSNVRLDELNELRRVRAQAMNPVPGDLQAKALRKISLKKLEAAIAELHRDGKPLSDEMRYLAGLQRIQFVFVYPEQQDVVLAGPGEGWKLNEQGEVVGLTTNRPVLLLDDLLVALRSIDAVQQTGITCSIDPTSEGLGRLKSLLKQIRSVETDPAPVAQAMEQSVGPQSVSVRGVPDSSHFARVLVAADYRMKRLAMAFDEPPIAGLPNYLQMIKSSSSSPKTMMPRWWLEPDYDALVTDVEGLAWELPRAGVKAMTEEEFLSAVGQRQRSGQASPLAKKWADNMTAHYDELAAKDSIFGQLRNCMDMAVVAALISKERLIEKCGGSLGLLTAGDLPVESYYTPRQVDSQASTLQKSGGWLISVSGGVQMAPWQMLERTRTSGDLRDTREKSASRGERWWWN